MCSAIVFVECTWAEIGGLDGLAYYVRFADPRALCVWEDDGDGVPGPLEGSYERVDVGGRLV